MLGSWFGSLDLRLDLLVRIQERMGLRPGDDVGDVGIDAVDGHPRLPVPGFLAPGGLLHAPFLQSLLARALGLARP